eukprot:TRINITY_DN1697_c0_g5_i1.p1 TRINITY_DN1697_c0_g5~~TRINITY_DN1697_c0_g5_i1.p1  ORF type:complete len:451 (-),score=88.01 TRINITY_DN1697_c0_g5_i1:1392-2744(-)
MDSGWKALTEASAGAVGSLLSTTLLYPLDTCKTKFQAEAKEGNSRRYRSMVDVLREALSEGQLLSLYQGLGTKNTQSVVAGFVYFYCYSYVKSRYLQRSGQQQMGMGANLVVASVAGACTAIVTQPLDTISARMQTSDAGTAKGFGAMLRERGLRQAYDGLGASLLLTTNPAIQYTVFEQLKERLLTREHQRRARRQVAAKAKAGFVEQVLAPVALSAFSAFVLGALSKTIATVITYPLIRCKVLMQREDTEEEKRQRAAGDKRVGAPRNMAQAFRIIWHSEGVSGFYKGLQGQVLKTVLAAALMLMIKEKVSEGTRQAIELLQKALGATAEAKRQAAAAALLLSTTKQQAQSLDPTEARSTSTGGGATGGSAAGGAAVGAAASALRAAGTAEIAAVRGTAAHVSPVRSSLMVSPSIPRATVAPSAPSASLESAARGDGISAATSGVASM